MVAALDVSPHPPFFHSTQALRVAVPSNEDLKLALTFIDDLALPDSVLLLSHAPASAASALLARLPASAAAARLTVMAQRHSAGVAAAASRDPQRDPLHTQCAVLQSIASPAQLHEAVAQLARSVKTRLGVSLTLATTLPLPEVPPEEEEEEEKKEVTPVRVPPPAVIR